MSSATPSASARPARPDFAKIVATALAVLIMLAPPPVTAEQKIGTRVYVDIAFPASPAEMEAARHWGGPSFSQGEAEGRPVTVRVGRSGRTTVISLESVAVCDRARACPLLVFRDITKAPVYQGWGFQNVILDYRDTDTWMILRVWDTVTECRLTHVKKAICRPLREQTEAAGR